MKNALELLKAFCTFDFVERDCEKALALLTDDVCWFGTSGQEDVHGLSGVRIYMQSEIKSMPMPYRIMFSDEAYVPMNGHIAKPINVETIAKAVHAVMTESTTEKGGKK